MNNYEPSMKFYNRARIDEQEVNIANVKPGDIIRHRGVPEYCFRMESELVTCTLGFSGASTSMLTIEETWKYGDSLINFEQSDFAHLVNGVEDGFCHATMYEDDVRVIKLGHYGNGSVFFGQRWFMDFMMKKAGEME